jgi:integrase
LRALRSGNDLAQITLADVEPAERGLRVRVPRSKTDQSGAGAWVGMLPQGRTMLCPVDAWHRWRGVRGDTPGPVFVGTTRAGTLDFGAALSERSIGRLVTGYAKRAGIELAISSHSLRATFATLATQKGKRLERVMAHGRWRSAETAIGYMRQAELFDDNASGGLLD